MAVDKLNRLAANVHVAGEAHSLEEGMRQPSTLPNEVTKIGVVISQDIGSLHLGQSIKQPDAFREYLADVALPQLEQVTADDKPTMIILHKVEE